MRSLARMPWQDRIVEAGDRMERSGGKGFSERSAGESAALRKEIFAQAQIPGTISMCEGGGAAPLHILIETENGWLVRVTLSGAQAQGLAELLLASVRKIE